MAISVVLVEGRKLLREALSLLLEKHADVKVVGEAEDTAAAVKLVRALAPDVVVLTMTATAYHARPVAEIVHDVVTARAGGTRVVVHAMYPTPAFVRSSMQL